MLWEGKAEAGAESTSPKSHPAPSLSLCPADSGRASPVPPAGDQGKGHKRSSLVLPGQRFFYIHYAYNNVPGTKGLISTNIPLVLKQSLLETGRH